MPTDVSKTLPEIPQYLAERPMFGKFPVPYITYLDGNGIPDFKVSDEKARMECIDKHLCGLCGVSLDYWICFVGGPKSIENRAFFDPGMHEACARYAMAVCPYLVNPEAKYAVHLKEHIMVTTETLQMVSDKRPDKLAIAFTRGYTTFVKADTFNQQRATLIKPAPFKRVEWF